MIFPHCESDSIVQVNDKFRIDVTRSYVSKDEGPILKVEIEPHTGDGFIDVTGTDYSDWYLDWQYTSDGDKIISVKVYTAISPDPEVSVTSTYDVTCLLEADDKLFSKEQELKFHESDIMRYLPQGRNTWKYMIRQAQTMIFDWLYTNGNFNFDGTRIGKDSIVVTDDLRDWSTFLTLRLIMMDMRKQAGDIFEQKMIAYEVKEQRAREKYIIRIDRNKDGVQDNFEGLEVQVKRLVRI